MKKIYLFLLAVAISVQAFSQNYTVLGNASSMGGCNCFRLTPDLNDQAGAIFQNQTIDLNNSFDFTFNAFLGCRNGNDAADGIVFVLTNNPNGLGSGGGGLGYGGGNQPFSLAVEFDTYENSQDPSYDHIAIESAGQVTHNVAGPVPALTNNGNVDNCQQYLVRIVWDVNTSTYSVYFDGVLRISTVIPNMVATYFGGNPIVNWGWTAGTGGGTNDQQICVLNTSSWVGGVNYQSCNTTFHFQDISTSSLGSVQSWAWTFGDGGTSSLQNPTHTYAAAGTYNVTLTITDLSGCTNTYTHAVVINPPITITPSISQPPCNGGSNGGITTVVTGGFGPSAGYGGYMYNWSNNTTGTSLVGASAGTYTLTVTDGVCSATGQYTVNQPSPLTATTTHTDASCNTPNGSATISISGGTPPYSGINWGPLPNMQGNTATGLGPGHYIADFHDANGCSSLLQYSETISSLPCGITSSTSVTNVRCRGQNTGSATLTVTGSTGTANIVWSNGTNGPTISNVAAGTYTYTYTDANPAHNFNGSVTITQPSATMAVSLSTVNMSCAASNNGQAIASVTAGGVSPYTYTWNPVAVSNPVRYPLSAGPVSVTVTDANSCTASASATITGPPTLTLSITKVDDSCYHSHTGSAMANVGGGNPPYTFYWSNISSAQNNLSLGAGTYTVTVTDDKGCSITGTTTLSEPPAFTHTPLAVTNVGCYGGSTGAIATTVSGGTPSYTYTWNPATASGNNPTGLTAGQYNLTITDARNCTIKDSAVIIQPASALTATTSHTNVSCNGGSDGTLTINVSGGTPPYSFLGNPVPAGTTTVPGRTAGTYAGNLTDANGCTVALSETITEPAVLTVAEQHVNVLCYGNSTGSIDITVGGGTTAYTYAWGDGPVTEDRTAIPAGTYSLTVTDANLCTATISVTITQPVALAISKTQVDILCNGASTGSIDVTVSGGVATYTYLWNDGPVTEDRTAISAGTYTVTATDQNGCSISISATIAQPTALTATTSHTNVSCNGGSDGTLTINVSGGTPPYSFLGNPVPAGSTTVPGRTAGTYAGNLTDANGCTVALSETITEPAVLAVSEQHADILCNGNSTGSIDITVIGGTTPYVYAWSDGPATEDRTGLPAGTYAVTVTDAHSCSATISVTLVQPTALQISKTQVDVLCNGASTGSIDVTVSGGVAAYTYLWNDGPVTEDRTAIAAGSYTVTATDQNACTISVSATITQPTALVVTTSHTDVKCHGGSDGTLTINVSGGTPPYSFLGNPVPAGSTTVPGQIAGTYAGNLTDGNGCSVALSETIAEPGVQSLTVSNTNEPCFGATVATATANFVNATGTVTYNWTGGYTGANISNLSAGAYSVTATDQNLCSFTGSVTVTEPAAQVMNVTVVNAACFGSNGSATANPAGGNAPYTYTWSGGGSGQTVAKPAGSYTVTATDASTCQQTASFSITEPSGMVITKTHTNLLCYGDANGDITLTTSGGAGAPYDYAWSANANTGNSNIATQLPAGIYTATVTDQAGCTQVVADTLTQPLQAVTINIQQRTISCYGANDGSITITTTGGTAPYGYAWNPNVSSTNSASNLSPANYSITVTDANGCSLNPQINITEPSQPLTVTASQTDLTCYLSNDGTASAVANGGTAPYSFSWNPSVSSTFNATGLAAGNYNLTVTDNNGCTTSTVYTINQPAELLASKTTTNVLCNGAATGSVTVLPTGGTPGYTYSWSPNVSSSDTVSGLTAGSYTITVSDSHNCTVLVTATITEPAVLSVTATSTPTACFNTSTGTITAQPLGGVPAYVFAASDGGNTYNSASGVFTGLAGGVYTVTVSDYNSCSASVQTTVIQPDSIQKQVNVIDATCYHYTDGSIMILPSGGTGGYIFSLSNGQVNTSGVFAGLSAGSYAYTITDNSGCNLTDSAVIIEPDTISLAVSPTPVEVDLGNDLQINTTTNQTGTVSYDWTPAFGLSCYDCPNPVFNGVYSQPYRVVLTNQAGCIGVARFVVTVVPKYDVFIPNAFTPNGDGTNDVWQIFGNLPAFKQVEVMVFNRIGEKVFQSNDIHFSWDGTYKGQNAPPGVYSYVAKFVWLDNHSDSNYKGTITLLR